MATLTKQDIVRAGLAASYAACAGGGDKFTNTGVEVIHIKNASVGSIDVTIDTPATVDGLAVAQRTVAVGAGAEKFIGPFPPSTYNDTGGFVNLSYSGVTTLTIAVLDPTE